MQENYDERLEAHLKDESNLRLYYEWKSNAWGGLFDRLEFFRILDSLYEFIIAHSDKPLSIEKRLCELNYSDQQNYRLLESLTKRLAWESEKTDNLKTALKVCREETTRLWRNMNWRHLESFNEDFHHFNIFNLQRHLATLPDTRTRLRYLIKLRTDVQQSFVNHEPFFMSQLGSEIEKLKQLQALEQNEVQAETSVEEKAVLTEKRTKESGTHYQNLLAIHYLLQHAKASCPNTKKAEFASFLTGFSDNTFRQQWSNIHRKKDENGLDWESDMKIVRSYFQELGLPEVVKCIDKELTL